jgi:hypothetical protein
MFPLYVIENFIQAFTFGVRRGIAGNRTPDGKAEFLKVGGYEGVFGKTVILEHRFVIFEYIRIAQADMAFRLKFCFAEIQVFSGDIRADLGKLLPGKLRPPARAGGPLKALIGEVGEQTIATRHVPGQPGIVGDLRHVFPVSGYVAPIEERFPLIEDGL